ncbi:MAG TPA: DUF6317 family protein [Pseudonocardiaceae bacterium]|nr:DUF6317 family protein [Pseudonocardiaceae bacterium]
MIVAGFQVALGDLDQMAAAFSDEAGIYQGIRAKLDPPVADSGDGTLDQIMGAVLDTLNYLHGKMTESIDEHAAKLRTARDAYAKNETSLHGLYNDLMPEEW